MPQLLRGCMRVLSIIATAALIGVETTKSPRTPMPITLLKHVLLIMLDCAWQRFVSFIVNP
jgi:hypothetical protein